MNDEDDNATDLVWVWCELDGMEWINVLDVWIGLDGDTLVEDELDGDELNEDGFDWIG